MPLKFHLDENIDSAIAYGLRRRGIDVTMPVDVQLIGASDEEHLAFALREQRVLLTHDDDFLAIAASGVPHAGILYCRPQSRSIGQNIAAMLLISDCLSADEMAGHVEFL